MIRETNPYWLEDALEHISQEALAWQDDPCISLPGFADFVAETLDAARRGEDLPALEPPEIEP